EAYIGTSHKQFRRLIRLRRRKGPFLDGNYLASPPATRLLATANSFNSGMGGNGGQEASSIAKLR
ncbi:MAG: hypothetical protein HWN68_15375, partial [Desulfobacterales bacterium]|nr:hypothetical protein [Desulfobacterales bacterium]